MSGLDAGGIDASSRGLLRERVWSVSRAPSGSLNYSVHRADALSGRDVAAIAPPGCDVLVWSLPSGAADVLASRPDLRARLRAVLVDTLDELRVDQAA